MTKQNYLTQLISINLFLWTIASDKNGKAYVKLDYGGRKMAL